MVYDKTRKQEKKTIGKAHKKPATIERKEQQEPSERASNLS